jgi:hypothetical protein
MKPKEYAVLDRAVLEGVEYGVMRAHKYTDTPTREHLVDEVHQAVMGGICEWFDLEPAPAEPEPPRPARVRVSGVPYEVDLSDGGHHD